MQLEKAACHVNAFFQLDDLSSFHPAIQRGLNSAGSNGFIAKKLFYRFEREVWERIKR